MRLSFRSLIRFTLCAALCPLLSGCGGSSDNNTSSPPVSATRQVGDLRLTLQADKSTYATGEPVHLTFTVTNTGTTNVAVVPNITRFPATIAVSRDNATAFYYGNPGTVGTGSDPNPAPLTFTPGETKTYTAVWDQLLSNKAVPGGSYTVQAQLNVRTVNGVSQTQTNALALENAFTIVVDGFCSQDSITGVPGEVTVEVTPQNDNASLMTYLATFGTVKRIDAQNAPGTHYFTLDLKPGTCMSDTIPTLRRQTFIKSADPVIFGTAA